MLVSLGVELMIKATIMSSTEAAFCQNFKRLSRTEMKINNIYQASNINEKELLEVVDIQEWDIWVWEVEIMIKMLFQETE